MSRFKKGDKVVCISSFSGLDESFSSIHHNPPKEGEEFTVIGITNESIGECLILGEVTNTQKYRYANDVWYHKKFKHLTEVIRNEIEEIRVVEYWEKPKKIELDLESMASGEMIGNIKGLKK